MITRPWSEFAELSPEASAERLPATQFYLGTPHIDAAQIRVVPTYTLTPLMLR